MKSARAVKMELLRRHAWKHNMLNGGVSMAQANIRAIVASNTTTAFTKELANEILDKLFALKGAMKERVDDDI